MEQKSAGAQSFKDTLGPGVPIVRFMVGNEFRGKPMLGLSVKANGGIYGRASKQFPEAKPLGEGRSVTWYPQAGLILFTYTRVDEAPGVPPVTVVEERWLNDSTDQLLWWETPSQAVRDTPRSK